MQDAPQTLQPLCWLNVVGLTRRLLRFAPRLSALAEQGCVKSLGGVTPALTTSAQASALTGLRPSGHGIVGNGWFDRDFGEVRMWPQSNALIQGEPVYVTAQKLAAKQGHTFTSAKVFWWFNQGAAVDVAVTPKPFYGSDGRKEFGVHGKPAELVGQLVKRHGAFPFPSFWGPMAGLPSSEWIAKAAVSVMRDHQPTFSMVYVPHLDYDLQRLGPDHPDTKLRVAEVDAAAGSILDAARATGTEVLVMSEYGLTPVSSVSFPNRVLRKRGFLTVRDGPFGETLETFQSRAFCVCDHQIAHVYVRDPQDVPEVAAILREVDDVDQVLDRDAQAELGLNHSRSGELVLLSTPASWFAYPYWLDDGRAPDFARSVDIHRKPGYDPAELFMDPTLRAPKLRLARRLAQKKLGFRYRMDVVPLDPSMVRGSHGLPPIDPDDGPLAITSAALSLDQVESLLDLKAHALTSMGLKIP